MSPSYAQLSNNLSCTVKKNPVLTNEVIGAHCLNVKSQRKLQVPEEAACEEAANERQHDE